MPNARKSDERWAWIESVTNIENIDRKHIIQAYLLATPGCKTGNCLTNSRDNPRCLCALGLEPYLGFVPNGIASTDAASVSLDSRCTNHSSNEVTCSCQHGEHQMNDASQTESESGSWSIGGRSSQISNITNDNNASSPHVTDEREVSVTTHDARSGQSHLVGLTNYGGTCYLNSFLQLYFRCPELVKAIYSLDSSVDEVVRELQTLFAELQLGLSETAEPAGLIRALDLSQEEQQDANEFRLLFMDLLDEHLRSTSRIIERLFVGTSAYITRCWNCGYESESPNKFQELLISLQHSAYLETCLQQTLLDEPMIGVDQVACPQCDGRRDGSRTMRLTRLPMELCFQVMRFAYDTKNQRRQKLRSPLVYPLFLDMQPFFHVADKDSLLLNEEGDTIITKYLLKGVLLHLGAQATGGHYVAFIRDYGAGWIVCNDADVTPLRAKTFRRQEELLANSMGHKLPVTKEEKVLQVNDNCQVSLSAYMLMYERIDVADRLAQESKNAMNDPNIGAQPPSMAEVPLSLAQQVNKVNEAFQMARAAERQLSENRWHLRSAAAHELPAGPHSTTIESLTFVTTDFLRNLFLKPSSSSDSAGLTTVASLSYDKFVCAHGKITPDSVGPYLKVVRQEVLEKLLVDLGREGITCSDRVMSSDAALCEDCVKQRCWRVRIDAAIQIDQDELDRARNSDYEGVDAFLVGRQSFKAWKKHARSLVQHMSTGVVQEEPASDFNADLLCEHGKLSPDPRDRRRVSRITWQRLLTYFPRAHEFALSDVDSTTCSVCADMRRQLIERAAGQRDGVLKDLFSNRRRPRLDTSMPISTDASSNEEDVHLYVVSDEYLRAWRSFLRNPSTDTQLDATLPTCTESAADDVEATSSLNLLSGLLCEHGLLRWSLDKLAGRGAFVTPEEWTALLEASVLDAPASVYIALARHPTTGLWRTIPEHCIRCFQMESESVCAAQLRHILLRILDEPPVLLHFADSSLVYSTSSYKKARLSNHLQLLQQDQLQQNNNDPSFIPRRSERARKHPRDVNVPVKADMTLRDLRIALIPKLEATPMEQHLAMEDGQEITAPGETTLRQLSLSNGQLLLAWVDKDPHGGDFSCDFSRSTVGCGNDGATPTETGFAGTRLLKR